MENRNKIIEEMAKCCTYYHNGECCADMTHISDCDLMCIMFGAFANLEMAGYRKERQGEWKRVEVDLGDGVKTYKFACTNCGFQKKTLNGNFCPNCGARMKGE